MQTLYMLMVSPGQEGILRLYQSQLREIFNKALFTMLISITSLAFYSSDSSCNGISSQVVNSYSKTGAIQLTKFDTTDKIVSGTFNFDFPISDCDTLHVREGRFDYHYY